MDSPSLPTGSFPSIYKHIWDLGILFNVYLFFRLYQVVSSGHTRELQFSLWHVGPSSLTRAQTQAPCIGSAESQPQDHQGRTWES